MAPQVLLCVPSRAALESGDARRVAALRRPGLRLFFALLLLLASCATAVGGSDPRPLHGSVVKEIQALARRHVDIGKLESTQDLFDRFSASAQGLNRSRIADVYEREYHRYQTQLKKDQATPTDTVWAMVKEYGGWLVALLLGVLYVARRVINTLIDQFGRSVYQPIRRWLGSRALFRRLAMRDYREALRERYRQVPLTFRFDRHLDLSEVFVPLRAREGARTTEVAALAAVAEHRRLMIVGPPGSGKSMLLKHIALKWATGALAELPEGPLPVLLELRHCSGETKPLREHLIDELEKRSRFPNAEPYLDALLESGRTLLLLDGLDEVASGKEPGQRDHVVRQIRELLLQYHRCRVIITCRSAVYREEFADLVDRRLEIVEFSDQEMYRFLSHWEKHMPAGHSVAQLMAAMGERPRIKHIARNPLMLTIIAVLYEDPKFVLPHSRAEFYQEATEVLLRHHHAHHNQFHAPVKRRILQHLAVFNQLNAMKLSDQDRRSMSFDDVLREVRTMLPDLNLDAGEADRVLREIVERSGLLLAIDGGERYQFAHLTLQEYFAADRLQNDYERLFEHFAQDPDGWLEPVKLWCGLASNSSALIEKVHGIHPLAAFECLANAQEVETGLADRILDEFTPALADESHQDSVLLAFAAVAADQRPRSQRVLALLARCLSSDDPVELRAGANALAATNLPEAAEILGRYYQASSACREALLCMGDLAVSVLGKIAADGDTAAMGQLRLIGTPAAAVGLASMLWHQDQPTARAAAWNLAGLTANSAIEAALTRFPLAPRHRDEQAFPFYDWVWVPFVEDTGSPLIPIMGRVAFLMDHSPDDELPAEHFEIDERLAYALALVGSGSSRKFDWPIIWESDDEFKRVAGLWKMARQRTPSVFIEESDVRDFFRAIKDDSALTAKVLAGFEDWLSTWPLWWTLVNAIPEASRGRFIAETLIPRWRRRATEDDWRNLFRPVRFSYEESWLFRGQLLLFLLVSLGVAIPAGLELAQAPIILTWWNAWPMMKLLVLPITILWVLFRTFSWRFLEEHHPYIVLSGALVAPGVYALAVFLLGLVGIEGPQDVVPVFMGWHIGFRVAAVLLFVLLSGWLVFWAWANGWDSEEWTILISFIAGTWLFGALGGEAYAGAHAFLVAMLGSQWGAALVWLALGALLAVSVVLARRWTRLAANPCRDLLPAYDPSPHNR